ncbi:anti-sigma factor antagonist BldG [Actinoallomurus bryophytorum]|uniref:Anti-sigma factor antagonist n=1 Tax=Actinoallomurus bryophytorum TaxID=1490222 RepID=A0A543BZC1_9ACTN|nr:STAS domain-containing protein [Actinoallomurus bryophytorum]TQL90172.1 SpoIIAA-like anti-anti-sigma regulatory factor [Actinoallomurus bryophytorum]
MDLSVESTVTDDGIAVLTISGPMDVETTPPLRDQLVRLVDEGRHRLVLDLSGVDFIDSIGLGVIVGMVHRLRPHDGSLAMAAPSPQARNVLQITQLVRVVAVCDTVEAAISAVRDGSAVVSATRRDPGGQAPAG